MPFAAPSADEPAALRHVGLLETEFQAFVNTSLNDGAPGRNLDAIDREHRRLALLRNPYIDVLVRYNNTPYAALAVVRLAELHLDLAARIRELPAPEDSTSDGVLAWGELLDTYAEPLEHMGVSTLRHSQLAGLVSSSPWGRRVLLYLALRGVELPTEPLPSLEQLRVEVGREVSFAAPRRLVQAEPRSVHFDDER